MPEQIDGIPVLSLINRGLKAVPQARYALGVVAIAILAGIARTALGGDFSTVALAVGVMLALSTLLVLFATFARKSSNGEFIALPMKVLLWSIVVLTALTALFSVSSFFFGAPLEWRGAEGKDKRSKESILSPKDYHCNIEAQMLPKCSVYSDDIGLRLLWEPALDDNKAHNRFSGRLVRKDTQCYQIELLHEYEVGFGLKQEAGGVIDICSQNSSSHWKGTWKTIQNGTKLFELD